MPILETPFDPKASPFALAADALWAGGYTIIPVVPRDKAPGDFRGSLENGSWGLMTAWNDYAHSRPHESMLIRWKTWPDANIGVVLGGNHGGYAVGAVDVDTDIPEEQGLLQGSIPPSPMRKAGSRGWTSFYRIPMDLKTKRYMVPAPTADKPNAKRTLLEILTGNAPRQTVMPPSMHPHGMPYTYITGNGVVPIHKLPVLTQDHIDRLEDNLSHLGWNGDDVERVDRATRGAPADDDNIWRETNDTAVANLDMWVGALGLPKLKRHGNGSWEAIPSFRASGSGQELMRRKSNLKFHRTGIRDMGTDIGYTAIDVVVAAFSWDFDSAFQWLRGKLGLKGEDDSFFALPEPPLKLAETADGSLIDEATGEVVWHQGAAEPPDGEPLADYQDIAPSLPDNVEIVGVGIISPEPLDAPVVLDDISIGSDELPDRLTRPKGLLGLLTDFITDTANTPNRVLSFAAALTLLGTIVGRKHSSPTASGTHLYALGLGTTGSGKQHPLTMVTSILTEIDAGALVGSSEPMSQTALLNQVKAQPLSLSAMDEFGAFLKRINAKNAGTHDMNIKKSMLSLWGLSFQPMPTGSWANSAATIIHAPAYSILGMATPESFYDALDMVDVENGMLNRLLILKSDLIAEIRPSQRIDKKLPEGLKGRLRGLYKLYEGLGESLERTDPEKSIEPIRLTWTEECEAEYYRRANEIQRIRNNPLKKETLGPFLGRTAEMALRIATIQSLARDAESNELTMEDLVYGFDVANWSAYSMARQAALYMSSSAHQSEANRIIELIDKRGGKIEHATLLRALRNRLKVKDVKDILAGLIEANTIQKGSLPKAGGGSPSIHYILQKQG